VQKRAAKFANNIKESGCETLAQRRLIARICALFKAYTEERAWKAIGNRFLKPCYLGRGDHNLKIRTMKQITDVGKYSFVNRTIKSWNQLPASLLASFPCKLKTGHGQHASKFFICVVLFVIRDVLLLIVMFYVLRVNVYCHRVPTQLQLTNISILSISINEQVNWQT
jgi:hypothetical protein